MTAASADDYLECPICLDLAINAVESDCCNNIFCEKCVNNILVCPLCRKPTKFKPSVVARRIIGSMSIECPDCGTKTSRGELPSHRKICPKRPFHCTLCKTFVCGESSFWKHLLSEHKSEIINNFEGVDSPSPIPDSTLNCLPVEKAVNALGNEAGLGETGKFYCGKRRGHRCRCCDANCGPNNGCNCIYCMKLDVTYRNLPHQHLVNNAGRVAKLFNDTHFHCYALVGRSMCQPRGWTCTHCRELGNPTYMQLL